MSFQAAPKPHPACPPGTSPSTQSHGMVMLLVCPHPLSYLSVVGAAVKKMFFFAPSCIRHHRQKLWDIFPQCGNMSVFINISHWLTSDEQFPLKKKKKNPADVAKEARIFFLSHFEPETKSVSFMLIFQIKSCRRDRVKMDCHPLFFLSL